MPSDSWSGYFTGDSKSAKGATSGVNIYNLRNPTLGSIVESKGMREIFQKKGKEKGKGKIFENLGKNVQNLKIFWKRTASRVRYGTHETARICHVSSFTKSDKI